MQKERATANLEIGVDPEKPLDRFLRERGSSYLVEREKDSHRREK